MIIKDIKTGVWKENLVGLIFNTIGVVMVCQMVLTGCVFFSFRDVIADSIEQLWERSGMMV
jgi:dihydroxy-acid dehydratase